MAAPRPTGNTRTDQAGEFAQADTVLRTRDEFDRNEKTAEAKNLATVAPDAGGMDITDRAMRMGKTMTSQTLMYRLHKINPNFVFIPAPGDATKYGIYLPSQAKDKFGIMRFGLHHITGMENTNHELTGGVMPEFSIIDTIEEMVPGPDGDRKRQEFKAETRGWRTVLAVLLTKRIITEGDVERYFGIVPSKDSARWWEIAMSPIELMRYQGVNYGPEGKADPRRGDRDARDRGRDDRTENERQLVGSATGEPIAQGGDGGAATRRGDPAAESGGEETTGRLADLHDEGGRTGGGVQTRKLESV